MRRSLLVLSAALVLVLPLGLHAKAQQAPEEAVAAQYDTITAKVLSVNYDKQMLSLEGIDGTRSEVIVDAKAKNFKNIKVGDLVVVRETRSLVLELSKKEKGQKPDIDTSTMKSTAPMGAMPGMENVQTTQISAEVVKVDMENGTVDLKGPQGNVMRLKAKDPNRLKVVKKGDMVSATYTLATAISVEKAPTK
jgi:hypothetical protein